jgi:surface antigen
MNTNVYKRTNRCQQTRPRVIIWANLLVPVIFLTLSLVMLPHLVGAQGVDCGNNSRPYTIRSGDTLSSIAANYNTSPAAIASRNQLADPNLIYTEQTICIPSDSGNSTQKLFGQVTTNAPLITVNGYPYGQCTWWANQRYHSLHGSYVPWTPYSNAQDWATRAQEFGWSVSSVPKAHDIIVLQPNTQGAGSLGHVAVVEQILPGGDVWTSNMNWGSNPYVVTYIKFTPGPGVTFIHQPGI